MASFFEPTGTLTGWAIQSSDDSETKDTAVALGSDGDALEMTAYHTVKTRTETYVANAASAAIPNLGATVNGMKVESLSVAFSATDYVKLTLNLTDAPISRTYTGTLTAITAKFGVPSTLCGHTITGARSATYNLSASKAEELGGAGTVIGAEIYDGVETLDVDGVAVPQTAVTGWTYTNSGTSKSNTGMTVDKFTATKHLAHNAA